MNKSSSIASSNQDFKEVTSFSILQFGLMLDYDHSDPRAHLAELVDALVLGTSDFGRGSSSLPVGIVTSNVFQL